MGYEQVRTLLDILGTDEAGLRSFIRDPEGWADTNAAQLSVDDRDELLRVAQDSHAFLETFARSTIGNKSELRFLSGTPLARRHFMVTAVSALLAGPLAATALGERLGVISPKRTGTEDDVLAVDTNCDDGGISCNDSPCTNSACSDDNSCKDSECSNTFACNDVEICRDTTCTNGSTVCSDSQCADVGCTNSTGCNDVSACTDDGCTNVMTCSDGNCTDAGCTNSGSCSDAVKGSCT